MHYKLKIIYIFFIGSFLFYFSTQYNIMKSHRKRNWKIASFGFRLFFTQTAFFGKGNKSNDIILKIREIKIKDFKIVNLVSLRCIVW